MSRLQPDNEDYRWLLDALGGPGTGPTASALARPSAQRPELFLPLGSTRVSTAALRRYHDGRSPLDRMKTGAAIGVARVGLLRHAPGDRVHVGPFAAVEALTDELDEPMLHVAITLGPRRRNRKPVLQLIRPDGSIAGFAKVGWSPFTRSLVENEAIWLRRLQGKTPSGIQIPQVLAEIDDGERLIVVTSPLTTSPRSGSDGRLSASTIIELARALGSEHVAFARLPQLEELRNGRVGALIDLDALTDRHRDARVELGSWHGDLTPWNTSTSRSTSRVWDWEFAGGDRPVGFDLLHNAFELVRRSAAKNEREAIAAVCDGAEEILAPIGQPVDAVVDLYLCELIQREARLRGEGWYPTNLGPLETVTVTMLKQRLA